MKNVNSIIQHLSTSPSFENLERVQSYKKLLSLLPQNLSKAVRFMYNKNETLFFVLEHPAFKMEFNYKLSLIKGLLKQLIIIDPTCKCIDAKDIKAFVTNKPPINQESIEIKPFCYEEIASGIFENQAKNPDIHKKFEAIRETIKCLKES